MNIKLKTINIKGHSPKENIKFKKLIDNSYHEWNEEWKIQGLDRENEISWEAVFEIEYDGSDFYFVVDTEGEHLTHIDLEGYMGGEGLVLDDELYLKIASRPSGILTALYFSEAVRHKLLNDMDEKILYYEIFPEWTRGLVPDNVDKLESVQKFIELFKPHFEELEILKEIAIDMDSYIINTEEDSLRELFEEFASEYFNNEVFFFLHNCDFVGSLKRLKEAAEELNLNDE